MNEENKLQCLLNDVNVIRVKHQEERNKNNKNGEFFNIFSVLGIESKEIRHSVFLAELLNPNGSHGMSDKFLKAFLDKINLSDFPLKEVFVKTEETIKQNRRLDISIESKDKKSKIVIENKIYTYDHDEQLLAYMEHLKENGRQNYKLVYLTLYGDEPQNEKIEDGNHFICLSYKDDIKQLLKNINSEESNIPTPISEIIREYIETIDKLTNQGSWKKMNNEILDTIIKTKNGIENALEIKKAIDSINRDELWEEFCEEAKNYIEEHFSIEIEAETGNKGTEYAITVYIRNEIEMDFSNCFSLIYIRCPNRRQKILDKVIERGFKCSEERKDSDELFFNMFYSDDLCSYFVGCEKDEVLELYKNLKFGKEIIFEKIKDFIKLIESQL